ncbi:ATP-dependent Clp protease ATP-binding subunit ClpC [Micromonospora purpureochromogenes]|uniref:ATP-dependent Clp protease ATP-binding subunit ClpC n=1 Tax=Micromonospora purpureochromogenes TaxID=47872 RepID=A0A1C4YZN7_9ACTN|nr:ATP-dependent Clp protease ATP-binding subunit [Micromonospora purpureochromogenes]SCF26097.1 ATP-dependent Clp protease ATP-binding subunit ClpC [Micromonospora purpureochromogenes]
MMGPGDYGSDPWDEFLARYFGRGEGGRRPAHRVDITRLMTADAREMLADAARRAAQKHSNDLDTDHLLWAALQREPLRDLVRRAGADPDALVNALGGRGDGAPGGEVPPNLSLTPAAKRALLDAHQLSRAMGANYIGPEHILMALPLNPESPAGRMLAAGRIQPESLQAASAERGPMGGPRPDRGTPTLDQYGQDLTELARMDQIDPVIGRADEIEQAVEILSRRTKNNPVLIGEAGVGKTAIVEGLAERICDGDVPQTLLGKRVVQLDLAGLVAGTRYRGDFEERLKKVIDEIRAHRDELIIFLDEIHTLVGAGGAGSEGGMDASNMLKPALARGELRVIGATTLDEYRKSIEKDAALARRFQPVLVPEPSVEDTVAILRGLRDRYEAHHQVRFTDEALVAAAELSDRYVTDRFLPDKAIDLIDQAGARVRLRTRTPAADVRELEQQLDEVRRDKEQAVADEQYERASALRDRLAEIEAQIRRAQGDEGTNGVPSVGPQEIAEVVSRATGIPVSQLTEEERDRLLRLEGQLHEKVVGQDDAVTAVAEAVRRSRTGLADPNRPMGSFLFLGPTGVGKTELARALAEALFGEADRMVRVDMSEFQERHTVARLVGAPPGYVGYEEAGQLTEAVRRRPYAVVLLDEIEKAHPDVFNILLQVLDDGRLTDSQGRTVNFKNTVLIMTSNLGSELITGTTRAVGFGLGEPGGTQESDELRERLMRRLQENFRPEFLNRIDETIIFRRLEAQQLRQITELLLKETRRRLHAQDVQVEFTTAGVDWLAEHGYQPEFGARPLRRVIQREVDNRLSRMLLENQLAPGQKITVDARDGQLTFDVAAGERGYTPASTSHPR